MRKQLHYEVKTLAALESTGYISNPLQTIIFKCIPKNYFKIKKLKLVSQKSISRQRLSHLQQPINGKNEAHILRVETHCH